MIFVVPVDRLVLPSPVGEWMKVYSQSHSLFYPHLSDSSCPRRCVAVPLSVKYRQCLRMY